MVEVTLPVRLLGKLDLRHGEVRVPPLGSARAESLLELSIGRRLARLTTLKDRYDPDNVFRMNASIPPAARHAQARLR